MSVLISGVDVPGHPPRDKHSLQSYEANKLDGKQTSRIALSKPSFHLNAPSGWQNDPCGAGYDSFTGLYHLFFQWNPYGNDWGNMSWCHATSSDLVSWSTSPIPAMTPSAEYDRCGVFTGCMCPTDIHGNPGALTVAYTSVSHLPIHYTLPYTRGSESLSLATSKDGGMTWQREDCNPILPGPPQHLQVTGWRDPYITTWDRGEASQNQHSNLYGFISGGISDQTPTIFVYSVNPQDLRQWQYTGLLTNVGLNFRPSRWSGDFGVNWEVTNLMTLTNDSGDSRDFVVMGVEGCLRPEGSDRVAGEARHRRDPRGQLWMSVKASGEQKTTENVLTEYAFAGVFDHGCLYAANGFWDPQTSRNIIYGWITEEDLPDGPRHRQGWSGMISLPRVVNMMTLRNVKKARSSPLHSITSIEKIPEHDGNDFTIHTLRITPDPRLGRLRHGATKSNLTQLSLHPSSFLSSESCLPLTTARWELTSEFSVSQACERVGIEIAHTAGMFLFNNFPPNTTINLSLDFEHRTTLAWHPRSETITIHRPSVENPDINHGHETAPHTLFTCVNEQGEETEENLRVHAFFDKSVLEVFVNERTVITTRIYHPSNRCSGLRFFAEPAEGQSDQPPTTLLKADVWDGLDAN
ncbi:Glycoside hydrolase family 32 [Penicillium cinerascens]|uniref:Glycoside hydrolase family 32 n=1 Tax=Penicillium cinerascens TaxID=70096 RepID=A0A9W9MMJ5_9EURO|nr:Glycoside hydrolase family 32 [Penicillium cinerascens]KAJ5204027.1 Glycoside hydrolase family 32 [Penicillium cinerascens]